MSDLLQILMAAAGSLGFGMLFRMKARRLGWAALGGGITWLIYLLCSKAGWSTFPAHLTATIFAAAWASALSHICKAPTTIFTITAIVPLIPGGMLYRTMQALVSRDPAAAALGTETVVIVWALAFGTMMVSVFVQILSTILRRHGGSAKESPSNQKAH